MKIQYEAPKLDIIEFTNDVVTLSGPDSGTGDIDQW